MPIRPENRDRYPDDWDDISARIRHDRAGDRCECRGECGRPEAHLGDDGRCVNRNGAPAVFTGSKVVLTVAHLNHTPEDCRDENLRAMCNGCHLHYDRDHHAETRARVLHEQRIAAGQGVLDLLTPALEDEELDPEGPSVRVVSVPLEVDLDVVTDPRLVGRLDERAHVAPRPALEPHRHRSPQCHPSMVAERTAV